MITYIETGRILHHPDNPRKNLGDLTELAESIKENGIFQNLTVVPGWDEGTYTAIIGHRRLEAAKLAGLEKVPCAVVEMDRKTQLSTMLLENMQRADLTVYEQGQGFQMMFDLGISVKEIAEKTGFGETTVRKRLAIAVLPEDKMKGAEERGGKLDDYVKISDIEDENERNRLLDMVGTHNFQYSLQEAQKKQMKARLMPAIKKELAAFGAKKGKDSDRWSSAFETVLECRIEKYKEGALTPSRIDEKGGYIWIETYGSIILMKTVVRTKKAPVKKSEKEKLAEETREKLKEIIEECYSLRKSFILSFNACKKYETVLLEWMIDNAEDRLKGKYHNNNKVEFIRELIGQTDGWYIDGAKLDNFKKHNTGNYFALICWADSGDGPERGTCIFNSGEKMPRYVENEALENIYAYLGKLGYRMSDTEKKMLFGTHELLNLKED